MQKIELIQKLKELNTDLLKGEKSIVYQNMDYSGDMMNAFFEAIMCKIKPCDVRECLMSEGISEKYCLSTYEAMIDELCADGLQKLIKTIRKNFSTHQVQHNSGDSLLSELYDISVDDEDDEEEMNKIFHR